MQKATRYEQLLLEQNKAGIWMFTVAQRSVWVEPCSTLHETRLQGGDSVSHSASGLANSTSLPASVSVHCLTSVTTVTKITHPVSLRCNFIVRRFSYSLTCSLTPMDPLCYVSISVYIFA